MSLIRCVGWCPKPFLSPGERVKCQFVLINVGLSVAVTSISAGPPAVRVSRNGLTVGGSSGPDSLWPRDLAKLIGQGAAGGIHC